MIVSGVKHKVRDSQFWIGLLSVKDLYVKKNAGYGINIKLREDWWVDNKPLNQF